MIRFSGKWTTAVALGVFLLGTAVLASRVLRHGDSTPAYTGYTVVSRIVFYPSGGGLPALRALRVRYQSGGGAFREVTTDLRDDGSASAKILFSVPRVGNFLASGDTVWFVSPALSAPTSFSEGAMKRSPQFNREERLAGYRVLNIHYDSGVDGSRDIWYAPELNGAVLQVALKSKVGTLKQELMQVTPGEPDPYLVAEHLGKTVSFASFEKRISKAEASGRHAEAVKLRHSLDDARKSVEAHNRENVPPMYPYISGK